MKALVTGGAGFIGSHLVDRLLAAGHGVAVLDLFSEGREDNLAHVHGKVEAVQGDVADAAVVDRLVSGRDIVYHLASDASVPKSVEDPKGSYRTNALGTHNVLRSAARHGVSRVVFASSAAIYGEPVRVPTDEGHPRRPLSPYGWGKLLAETMGLEAHRRGAVAFAPLRLFNVYGPRTRRYVLFELYRKAMNHPGPLEILGDGQQRRDFVFVEDVVDAFLAAGEREGFAGRPLNVGTGTSTSVAELARELLHALDRKETKLAFTGSSWAGDVRTLWADIGAIERLGWRPRVSLREGVARTVAWMRAQPL